MDREIGIILVLIAAIGMLSTLFIVRRERIASMGPVESRSPHRRKVRSAASSVAWATS